MLSVLKLMPSWFVLFVLLLVLMVLYQVRPDATTEDMVKGVLGALLLSLRQAPPQPPPDSTSQLPPTVNQPPKNEATAT